MKNKIKYLALFCGISLLTFTTSCSDSDEEIKSVTYDRLFSPTGVEAKVQNKTNVRLSWEEVNGAEAYTIELFANDSLEFAGSPVATYNDVTDNPYTITGLMGETQYSARIKAIGQDITESKWSGIAFETEAEQIFKSIQDEDLKATEVTLRWPAGEMATEIVITPGEIKHTVTVDEVSSGAATITGLSGETEYTAKLMNGTKTRGSIKFTTLADFGDSTPVNEGDDLISLLNEAEEGESFIIVSGVFNIDNYELTKSVKIAGFKPNSKPTINGRFTVASGVESLTLSNIIFDGKNEIDNIIELTDQQGNLGTLNIDGCEIRNMKKHIIYNNKKGTFGDITINNCIIDGIANDAGDGFDLRGGALSSLKVSNTTISNGIRSLVRCQVPANVEFTYCTFYNICTTDDSNNTGLFRVEKSGSKLTVHNCLLSNIGIANPANVNSGTWGRSDKLKADEDIKNIYYFNSPNLWTNSHKEDFASFATEADPGFKNAAENNLTLSNEDMIDKKIGDPRWY